MSIYESIEGSTQDSADGLETLATVGSSSYISVRLLNEMKRGNSNPLHDELNEEPGHSSIDEVGGP